jgi:hypothetical protein
VRVIYKKYGKYTKPGGKIDFKPDDCKQEDMGMLRKWILKM